MPFYPRNSSFDTRQERQFKAELSGYPSEDEKLAIKRKLSQLTEGPYDTDESTHD